jgi:hypothetical protein
MASCKAGIPRQFFFILGLGLMTLTFKPHEIGLVM